MKNNRKTITKSTLLGLGSAMLLQTLMPISALAEDINTYSTSYTETVKTGAFVDKTVTIDNETLSYSLEHKDNKKGTIIYIHGALFSKDTMRPLANSMTDDYQNLVLDLSGHGKSTGSAKLSVKEYADTVQKFIANLQAKGEITDNVTLVGWSMGGAISLDLALRDIPSVKNVVLVSSGSKFFVPQIPAEYFDVNAIVNSAFTSSTTDAEKKLVMDLVDKSTASLDTCMLDFDIARQFDITNQINNIDIPVLIISGSSDFLATPDNQREMDALIPNSELKMYENRGHCLVMEEADQLANDIRAFIE